MKLHTVSTVLLFVQLVLAKLPPSTTKILYESGYVVAVNFDARVVTYYHKDGDLVFETKNNNSMVHLDEFMKIKGDELKKRNASFAVVSFAYKPTDKRDNEFCRQQSSEKLRNLIASCHNKIILRELTEDEERRIQQYKEEQAESEMPFQVSFERNEIRTQSVGLDDFKVARFNSSDGYTTFYVLTTDRIKKQRNMWLANQLMERSFIIEGLPANSGVDCYRTISSDLRPFDCVGDIRLREKNDDVR